MATNISSSPNNYEPLAIGGLQLAIADFNLDGNPDIAFDGQILVPNGNGTFQAIPAVTLGGSQGPDYLGAFVKNGAGGRRGDPPRSRQRQSWQQSGDLDEPRQWQFGA